MQIFKEFQETFNELDAWNRFKILCFLKLPWLFNFLFLCSCYYNHYWVLDKGAKMTGLSQWQITLSWFNLVLYPFTFLTILMHIKLNSVYIKFMIVPFQIFKGFLLWHGNDLLVENMPFEQTDLYKEVKSSIRLGVGIIGVFIFYLIRSTYKEFLRWKKASEPKEVKFKES